MMVGLLNKTSGVLPDVFALSLKILTRIKRYVTIMTVKAI